MNATDEQFYRHCGVGLLRAAVAPPRTEEGEWPELSDTHSCRAWLTQQWMSRPELAGAIQHASPSLGDRLAAIVSGEEVAAKHVRRAARATVRYLLRSTGRHTPFGLFAGVAPVTVGGGAAVRWGRDHRQTARVDNQWLATVINSLENRPDLLPSLEVAFTNLALARGRRLESPSGPNRISVRHTPAVQAVREIALLPIRFSDLAENLVAIFPLTDAVTVESVLTELVKQGFLLTCLRAPLTNTDPLGHLIEKLDTAEGQRIGEVTDLLVKLKDVQRQLHALNTTGDTGPEARARLTRRLDDVARAATRLRQQAGLEPMSFGRVPLSLDVRLDSEVNIPEGVAEEMERAASALIRLSRQPTGEPTWRAFYTAFCDRYGTGSLVPLLDVVDPDSGLGFPAGYPDSVWPTRPDDVIRRDGRLLAMAWRALADKSDEILLDNDLIRSLTVGDVDARPRVPPHVELAARVHATSLEALDRGDYHLKVTPGRSAGTFTARFTSVCESTGLEEFYRTIPTAVTGAVPVQMSFPPVYAHAENISRVPAYLPHVLPLGEHRDHSATAFYLEDLAVIASQDGLHLVSASRGQIVEPQVLHGLNLEKQPPTLARFLIHLSRGLAASWSEFDWGPHASDLPYLPRVRYGRTILAPARWRLNADDLQGGTTDHQWGDELRRWRDRWRCPRSVELADADRTLPLDLCVPAHAAILRAHLELHRQATLTESVDQPADYGWIGGHAHEIVLPLVTTRPSAPSPLTIARPVVTNQGHGQLPGSPRTTWLNVKVHTHPQMLDDLLVEYLPELWVHMPGVEPDHWFIRYRSPNETDHLRLRIRTPNQSAYMEAMAAVGAWAEQLRADGLTAGLVVDTYRPEVGRYGYGPAMAAAEVVFVADSLAVATQLRHLPDKVMQRRALAAVNMIATVHGLTGDVDTAIKWLVSHPIPGPLGDDRSALQPAVAFLAKHLDREPFSIDAVARTWQARTDALAAYRDVLPPARSNTDLVLESLLHMHHNRLIGIDRTSEARCRRLARHTALAWAKQWTDR